MRNIQYVFILIPNFSILGLCTFQMKSLKLNFIQGMHFFSSESNDKTLYRKIHVKELLQSSEKWGNSCFSDSLVIKSNR